MKYSSTWKTVLLLSAALCCSGQTVLKAKLNNAGIKGDVTLRQESSTTTVTFNLVGVTAGNRWEFGSFWVDLTVQNKCDSTNIGPRIGTIGGMLNSGSATATIESSDLGDLKTMMGRSIVIRVNETNASCGTLVLDGKSYTTAHVQMQDTVTGDIWFRQAGLGERTEVYSDLFNSVAEPSTPSWKIYYGSSSKCKHLTSSSLFNPTFTANCTNIANCTGDLSGKIGNAKIGKTKGSRVELYQDSNLPLSGSSSIIGQVVVILDNTGTVTACGDIREQKQREVMAYFNRDGVYSTVTFEQKSPFDTTRMTTNILNLRSKAGGFHVHVYPVPQQVSESDELCSADAVGGHWNPFNMAFPSTGRTHDEYEVGDLSGKFGSLTNKDNYTVVEEDFNLPLFGPYSIVGRSLVIHKDLTRAPRWVCTNIFDTADTAVAVAKFTYPVIGHMVFTQLLSNPQSETWIYGELNYGTGHAATLDHIWMVHSSRVGGDAMADKDRCASTGRMFNPFGVDMSGDRKTECKITNPLRCPVGSGSMQTMKIPIRKSSTAPSKFLLTTRNLPLSGPGSILGRALGIHDNINIKLPLACATIFSLKTRKATVKSWSSDITGFARFYQKYSIIEDRTRASITIKGLNKLADGYHVHKFPVPSGSLNPCSGRSVSGHLNPFNVDKKTSPSPATGTHDLYEVGDLSGKYGTLKNVTSLNISRKDYNLNLFGIHSIVGRSIVIHRMDKSRWTCGTIVENMRKIEGFTIKAKASFSASDNGFAGEVIMTQHVYIDGRLGSTSVFVMLNYTDKPPTTGHRLSVGTMAAFGDRTSSTERCDSTGPTLNPFSVNTKVSYDECRPNNQLRCMMGDISGKLGTIRIDGKKMFSTDMNLPLIGKNSIIGRSVVIGDRNGGSGRIACANLMPMQYDRQSLVVNKPPGTTLDDIGRVYAKGLKTDRWNVAVYGQGQETDGCVSIVVYFMGKYSGNLKHSFQTFVQYDQKELGSFKSVFCSGTYLHLSLLTVMLLLVCKTALV